MILFRDFDDRLVAINPTLIRRIGEDTAWCGRTAKEIRVSVISIVGDYKYTLNCPFMEVIKAIDHCSKTGEHADLTAWEMK